MVLGSTRDEAGTAAHEPFGERSRVLDDATRVAGELRLARFGERDRLRRHDMRHRPSEHGRTALVDELGVFGCAQHEAAARPAQRLVRRRRDHVRVRYRIEVAGEDTTRDEPGEMRHVDHERRVDLVGDLAQDAEVRVARVRGVAGHDDERAELERERAHRVVVDLLRARIHAVAPLVEQLARDVGAEPVGEVSARVE